MRVERTALAAAAALVLASLVVGAAVPAATSEPEQVRRPGQVAITEVSFASGAVTGDTATLNLTTFVAHRGGPSRNVTVAVRVIDLDTGLVATTTSRSLGTVTGDREVTAPASVTVEREGGYRFDFVLYQDGRRIASVEREVRGVGSLEPDYARSSVRFHRFQRSAGTDADGGLPPVQYSVASADDGTATLDVFAFVTNQGSATSGLTVEFLLRQAESNIVAARATTDVGNVRAGRTATPSVTVTVPDGYNYYIDAILFKDGVIVDSTRGAANLDPSTNIDVDESDDEGGLNVSDFTGDEPDQPPAEADAPDPTPTSAPGLTAAGALLALAIVAALARRRS